MFMLGHSTVSTAHDMAKLVICCPGSMPHCCSSTQTAHDEATFGDLLH